MNSDFKELFREANRDIRRASGLPIDAEDQAEEQRQKALKDFQLLVHRALGLKGGFALLPHYTWIDNGPTAEMTVDEQRFLLATRDANAYVLRRVVDGGEKEIASFERKDPLFGSRVIVAIGENLSAND